MAVLESGQVGSVHDRDMSLIVLGPLFETETAAARLAEMGLEYFDDFFEVAHSGGVVPDWCAISLALSAGA